MNTEEVAAIVEALNRLADAAERLVEDIEEYGPAPLVE
jgi:hypothetical protein